jgi:glycine/D-amino acid oxidase-like deaminating enzyme
VVVGGGSTGSSILYHLAKGGVRDAVLVERGPSIASGQTSRSTALVRTHYTVPVVARMALLSYGFFKSFENKLPGHSAGYIETGLLVGVDSVSEDALKESVKMFERMGIVSRFVSKDEARRLEPMLDSSNFSAVVHEPGMGYAEPTTTAVSFAAAAEEMGAKVLTNTVMTKITKTPGGYALSTTNGEISASKVVLATGVWSGPIFQSLGVAVPIKVVRHPVAIYRRPDEFRGVRPCVFDFPQSAYYKPEGGSLLFVGSLEAELDEAGSSVDPDNYDTDITFEEVERLSTWTSQTFPIMASKGKYERGYGGVYDDTPDQQPVIDELSAYGFPNLYCLVGLSGHGFKLSPEFGRIMASLVTRSGFSDYDVSVFGLKRFETGKLMRGRYNISTVG